jgi:hypothetical protein
LYYSVPLLCVLCCTLLPLHSLCKGFSLRRPPQVLPPSSPAAPPALNVAALAWVLAPAALRAPIAATRRLLAAARTATRGRKLRTWLWRDPQTLPRLLSSQHFPPSRGLIRQAAWMCWCDTRTSSTPMTARHAPTRQLAPTRHEPNIAGTDTPAGGAKVPQRRLRPCRHYTETHHSGGAASPHVRPRPPSRPCQCKARRQGLVGSWTSTGLITGLATGGGLERKALQAHTKGQCARATASGATRLPKPPPIPYPQSPSRVLNKH